MKSIIAIKKEELRLSNLSDVMFYYSSSDSMIHDKQFMYFLEKEANLRVTLKEEFNTLNSARLLWGFSKFINRSLTPAFNHEISGSILNR